MTDVNRSKLASPMYLPVKVPPIKELESIIKNQNLIQQNLRGCDDLLFIGESASINS